MTTAPCRGQGILSPESDAEKGSIKIPKMELYDAPVPFGPDQTYNRFHPPLFYILQKHTL